LPPLFTIDYIILLRHFAMPISIIFISCHFRRPIAISPDAVMAMIDFSADIARFQPLFSSFATISLRHYFRLFQLSFNIYFDITLSLLLRFSRRLDIDLRLKIEPLLITPPFSLATPPFSSFLRLFTPLRHFRRWLLSAGHADYYLRRH
jgi:hypothetical protein